MSQDKAFISFEDALRMRECKRYGWGELFGIFLFAGVEIKNDFSIDGSVFGEEFSDWTGKVCQDSILFDDRHTPFYDLSGIRAQWKKADYTVSLAIDQRLMVGGDFFRSDIRVFEKNKDITDRVFSQWTIGTKENVFDAMQHCNKMIVG